MFGGHLDSFDVATGAIDDGAGATPTIEAGRLIMAAGGKPKRSILVCLWQEKSSVYGVQRAGLQEIKTSGQNFQLHQSRRRSDSGKQPYCSGSNV